MLLLTILLFLTAIPDQSLGQEEDKEEEEEEEEGEDLSEGSGLSLELQQEIVDKHNEMRRNVNPTASNMLKMMWNETVGESARRWAEKCQEANSPVEDRTFDGVLCGQSIFQSNFILSWSEVMDYWRNKSQYFKYGVGALDPDHSIYGYTQAIWYRSHQIGCALSHCPSKEHTYRYICQYCPTGNIATLIATPYKEGPPCGDCPNHCEDKLCTNPCKYMDKYKNCAELKKHVTCKHANKHGHCKATCKCRNKIK